MTLPDNNSSMPPEQNNAEPKSAQEKPVQMGESAVSSQPLQQPQNTASDDSAVQKITTDIKNSPVKQQPVNPQPNQVPRTGGSGQVSSKTSDPYIKAAESVIERDKNDPYKEEEDHEEVQIKYLHDRFGKNIGKS